MSQMSHAFRFGPQIKLKKFDLKPMYVKSQIMNLSRNGEHAIKLHTGNKRTTFQDNIFSFGCVMTEKQRKLTPPS